MVFDEMDEVLRSAALQALSDAPFRVVVLTRGLEMIEAARKAWLVGAVAVQLHDVSGPEAVDYLQRARTGPPPAGWPMLLTHLREHPDGRLARGLSTPLTLTLLRDTYGVGDDVGELLDPTRYSTPEQFERHLIERVLPAAYKPHPGRPPPRYSEAQARQTLTHLALQMHWHHTRDFAWWQIPQWTATTPRVFSSGLRFGLRYGLIYGVAFGLTLALTVGLLFQQLTVELVIACLIPGLILGLMFGPMFGIMGGLQAKLASMKLMAIFKGNEPRRMRVANWRAVISRRALRLELISGAVGGLTFASLGGLPGYFPGELPGGHLGGLVIGFAFGFAMSAPLAWLTEGDTDGDRPLGPQEILRSDRAASLLYGVVYGLAFGFVYVLAGGGLFWFVYALLFSVVMVGFFSSQICRTILAWHQLKIAGYVPAVKLMTFLEDARERDVLRTVGAVYQFRHAKLQDQLVELVDQTAPNSAVLGVS